MVWVIASTADALILLLVVWGAAAEGWEGSYTALVILCLRGPAVVGGVLGGWCVDRFGAVPVLAFDLAARAACAGGLMWTTSGDGSGLLIVFAAVAGLTSPACYAATRSLVASEVTKDRHDRAFTWLAAGDQLPFLVSGVAVAGAVSVLGFSGSFGLVSVLLLVCLALVLGTLRGVRGRTLAVLTGDPAPAGSLRAIIPFLSLSVCFYFVFGPFTSLLPRFARDAFDAGAQTYGAMLFTFAVGSICGLVGVSWTIRRLGALATPTITAGFGLVVLCALLSPSLGGFMIGYLLAGVAWGPYTAVESTFISRLSSPEARGRVFGVQAALLRTAVPLGSVMGLFLIDHYEARQVLMASAIASVTIGVVAALVFWSSGLNRRPGMVTRTP